MAGGGRGRSLTATSGSPTRAPPKIRSSSFVDEMPSRADSRVTGGGAAGDSRAVPPPLRNLRFSSRSLPPLFAEASVPPPPLLLLLLLLLPLPALPRASAPPAAAAATLFAPLSMLLLPAPSKRRAMKSRKPKMLLRDRPVAASLFPAASVEGRSGIARGADVAAAAEALETIVVVLPGSTARVAPSESRKVLVDVGGAAANGTPLGGFVPVLPPPPPAV